MIRPHTLLLSLALLTGCGTVFHGTKTDITVQSNPQQAAFSFTTAGNGQLGNAAGLELASGVTPATVTLSNKNDYVLRLKLEGYQETRVLLDRSMSGWFICSLLCGLVPAAVDVVTGGMWKLEPEQLVVELKPLAVAPAAAIENIDGVELPMQAVLYRKGSDGQLRYLAIPLVRE